ncbi:Pkinase-domain-containing protein [Mycena indigotica]|uniref:Pkinase-domain-containing protein n=1 Tax=Mycena indigotica TaxID=2126181 RepID=A0A8H6TFS2_9AGAR|nr:Pkinase-domain-containing protein [Mycena indigotica]KAF7315937.1 Pkinase-domain-containing protein [Mycena indigotica]
MSDDQAQFEDLQQTQPDEPTQPSEVDPSTVEPTDELWGYLHPCASHRLKRIDFFKSQPEVSIGRNNSNMVILPGFKISNFHADLKWNQQDAGLSEVTIMDKSSNGTYVCKGQKRILKDGNEIAFGVAHLTTEEEGLYDYRYVFRDFVSGSAKRALYTYYDLSHQLGKGSFATVYRALHRASGQWVAVKVIHETKRQGSTAAANSITMFSREIKIMENLQHPNICMLREVFWNTNGSIDLVLELVEGGDLLDFILGHNGLTEPMSQHITYQLCQALAHIHSKGITHRDLKPENVLLTKENPPVVKVADFGLAKIVDSMTMLRTMCGTPSYLAPEVVTQQNHSGYDSLVDSWSVGVIVFCMQVPFVLFLIRAYPDIRITNTTPFIENSVGDLRTKIAERTIDWTQLDNQCWTDHNENTVYLSVLAKDFIRQLLEFDPQDRLQLSDALRHPWFHGFRFYYADKIKYPPSDEPDMTNQTSSGGLSRDVSMQSVTTTFSFSGHSETDSVSQGLQDLRLFTQRAINRSEPEKEANGFHDHVLNSNGNTPPPTDTPLPTLHKNGLNRRSDVLRHAKVVGSQLLEPSWEMVEFANSQSSQNGHGAPSKTPSLTATGKAAASTSKTPRPSSSNGKGPNKRVHSELTPLPEESGLTNGYTANSSPLSSPGPDSDDEEVVQQPVKKRGRGSSGATPTIARTKRGSAKPASSRKGKGSAGEETPLRRSTRSTVASKR